MITLVTEMNILEACPSSDLKQYIADIQKENSRIIKIPHQLSNRESQTHSDIELKNNTMT